MKVFSTIAALLAVASAEAEPGYYKPAAAGVAHHPYGGSSYRGRTVYGYPSHGYRGHYLHKREADAEPGYGYGPVYSYGYNVHQSHPGHARSYQYRKQYGGHYIHKREAMKMEYAPAKVEDAPAKMEHPRALAHHPYGGTSYVGRTVFGYPSKSVHKREADAEPGYGYGPVYSYGYNVHQSHPGHARSYQYRKQYGGHYIHKREADAGKYYSYKPAVHHPKGATSYVAPTTYGYPSHGYSYGYKGKYYH